MSDAAPPSPPPPPGAGASAPAGAGPEPDELVRALHAARHHLEALIERFEVAAPAGERRAPWMHASTGEERWPAALAIIAAIALQFLLPDRLSLGQRWLVPSLESLLAVGLIIANPRRINRRSRALRSASVAVIALTSLANGWSSYELVREIITGKAGGGATALLATGAAIYVTNIIVFALWYWEWDRGGPVARALGERVYPDLLFPQMVTREITPETWRPTFVDYLYVSYTNATAFSPTDTMPMARWTKLLFLAQSAIALCVAALVIARAVNILR
ncbi:MAG: hypothetical protein M0004_12920 [Actinomycetota bacterium]|nr:hypothetical protein [Actinomycetota bacterium]